MCPQADANPRSEAGSRTPSEGSSRLETISRQNRLLSEQVRFLSEHVRFLSEQLQTVARELETVHLANRRLLRRYFVFRPLALARKAVGITKDKSARRSLEKKLGEPTGGTGGSSADRTDDRSPERASDAEKP